MKPTIQQFSRRRATRGMTLIEIIVVILIITMLMTAVGVAVIPQFNQAKIDRTRMDISNIETGLDCYYLRKGKRLQAGSLQPVVDANCLKALPKDPWEKEYVYVFDQGKGVITSYGEDGQQGGEGLAADISSKDTATK